MDQYGVAYATRRCEEPHYMSNYPQVIEASTEKEAIDLARKMSNCRYVTPFRNLAKHKEVNWAFIKENEIAVD